MKQSVRLAFSFFAAFFVLFLGRASATDVILTLPFENVTNRPEQNWVRESFTVSMADLLDAPGLIPIQLDERNLAFEKLGVSRIALITRATELKLGETVGADIIIRGTYSVSGDGKDATLTVRAQMISLREGKILGSDHTLSGPLNELQLIQGKLAWELLYQRNTALPFSRDQLIARATRIDPSAYEIYVKALLTESKQDRTRLLIRAIEEAKKQGQLRYPQAVFELGATYYRDGQYADAQRWFEQLTLSDPRGLEARFHLGVSQLLNNETDASIKTFSELLTPMPLYETYGNAGVAHLNKGNAAEAARLLKLASEAAAQDDDTLFNYGYALWREEKFAEAVARLETLVKRSPKQGQAFYLLAKSYAKLNRQAEAETALNEAKKYLADFAKWETSGKIPPLGRPKLTFNREAFYRYGRSKEQLRQSAFIATSQSRQAEDLLNKAQADFLNNQDEAAIAKLSQALQSAPDNGEAHLLLGRLHERRGELVPAINALKAAVFWNPKLTAAHVLLGRIFVRQGDRPRAETHLKLALAADPNDREALALQRLLQQPVQQNP
jgi:tetratricopeptide (TPR) repeat protein